MYPRFFCFALENMSIAAVLVLAQSTKHCVTCRNKILFHDVSWDII